jgi:hypothetical protein
MNIFDSMQDLVFDTISETMGTECTWQPLDVLQPLRTAKVLYNAPSESKMLAGVEYNPIHHHIEFKKGDLPGLFESARNGHFETVTVNGSDYYVREVNAYVRGSSTASLSGQKNSDGKTIIARIEPIND